MPLWVGSPRPTNVVLCSFSLVVFQCVLMQDSVLIFLLHILTASLALGFVLHAVDDLSVRRVTGWPLQAYFLVWNDYDD